MDSLLEHDRDILRPPWGEYGRDVTLGLVAGAAKLLLRVLNKTDVAGGERYRQLVMQRPPGVGLITYSNHTSTFDDPGLPCAMLPWSFFWTEHVHHGNRWTMCARDICFPNEFLKQFFLSGKTLPVERGAGVQQPALRVAAARLAAGDWVHLFPEGRVGASGALGAFRQGIGKLVCDARAAAGGRDPLVLPYTHSGMGRVLPYRSQLPRVGHTVTVVVGEPLDLSHVTCRCDGAAERGDAEEVWRDIAAAMRDALEALQEKAPLNPDQLAENPGLTEAPYPRRRALVGWLRGRQGAGAGGAGAPEAVEEDAAGGSGGGGSGSGGGEAAAAASTSSVAVVAASAMEERAGAKVLPSGGGVTTSSSSSSSSAEEAATAREANEAWMAAQPLLGRVLRQVRDDLLRGGAAAAAAAGATTAQQQQQQQSLPDEAATGLAVAAIAAATAAAAPLTQQPHQPPPPSPPRPRATSPQKQQQQQQPQRHTLPQQHRGLAAT